MEATMQEALFKDPRVQQSIKTAGHDALSDPQVQKEILAAVQEKFPEHAGQAALCIKKWAKDPAVQAKAKEYAGVAWGYAKNAGSHVMKRIEQGPAGVRVLAFLGSLASCVNALRSLNNELGNLRRIV
jgi:hypothetical protein